MVREDQYGRSQSYKFTVTPDYFRAMARPPSSGMMRFSSEEIRQIFISVLVLTIAFALVFTGGIYGLTEDPIAFGYLLLPSLLAVSTAFLMHELAHKKVAQSYGCFAEYRMSTQGLFLAIITGLIGFLFALPGAVYISGHIDRKQNAKISMAGPGTNMAIGAISLMFVYTAGETLLGAIASIVAFVNLWLAVFNLLPIPPLDGSKILAWNIGYYILAIVAAVALLAFAWIGI